MVCPLHNLKPMESILYLCVCVFTVASYSDSLCVCSHTRAYTEAKGLFCRTGFLLLPRGS